MTQTFLPFLAAGLLLFSAGCDRDPYPLELPLYDVHWTDADDSGSRTAADELHFLTRIGTTDPDPENQFITAWEFSFTLNGTDGGVLQGDNGLRTNAVNLDALVSLENLDLPGADSLEAGDRLVFYLWAIDNCETQLEKTYSFEIEE
jgi:hypothetical protein